MKSLMWIFRFSLRFFFLRYAKYIVIRIIVRWCAKFRNFRVFFFSIKMCILNAWKIKRLKYDKLQESERVPGTPRRPNCIFDFYSRALRRVPFENDSQVDKSTWILLKLFISKQTDVRKIGFNHLPSRRI